MQFDTPCQMHPGVMKIQCLLQKIDCLHLPQSSKRDVESILVHQVAMEIDHALPWQTGHGRRTAATALMIGKAAALDAHKLHDLKLAALLHDIGLLMISPHLTSRRDSLHSDDYVVVQNHTRLGANMLEPFSFLKGASLLIAHHHERWDGSGYPYGIRGEFIPLGARILSIADAFDAIHVPVASRPRTRNDIAIRILLVSSGTQFDPRLVQLLHLCLAQSDSLSRESERPEMTF